MFGQGPGKALIYHLGRMETGLFIIGMLYLALSIVAIFNLFMQPRRRRRS
jgi:hypothetical protein